MKRINCVLTGIVITLLLITASIPATAHAAVVRIGGSGFSLGVMKIMAGAYEKSHPGTKIEVIPSLGSTGGIKALTDGALDIAFSGRLLTTAESNNGINVEEISRSPLIFVTSKGVKKEGLTIQELENIYSGKTMRWPDGTRVRLILRPESDIITKLVRGLSPAMNKAVMLAMSREGMIRAITDQESADLLEKTPGALEASTLTQVLSETRKVNLLSFNGVKPTVAAISDGSYPHFIPMYLLTSTTTSPTAMKFVEYIYSETGRAILANNGNYVVKKRKDANR